MPNKKSGAINQKLASKKLHKISSTPPFLEEIKAKPFSNAFVLNDVYIAVLYTSISQLMIH